MRRWPMRSGILLIAALLVSFSCDNGPGADSPLSPTTTSGDLLGLPILEAQKAPAPTGSLVLVEEDPTGNKFGSALIGLLGGALNVGDHGIVVPRGAVLKLTLFTMAVPSTSVIDADLQALVPGVSGLLSSLGLFQKPVTLEMSYANAKGSIDPGKLVIVRLLDNGTMEVMPTKVDKRRKVISAELEHFSKYAMASN